MLLTVVVLVTGAVVAGSVAFVVRHLHQLKTGAQAPDRDSRVTWVPGNGRHGGT